MSSNRIHHVRSPSSGRFIVNFNGVEKRISLKQNKGDYTIDRLKKKVFTKFKKLGTTDFDIQMDDGLAINTDGDILLYLLGHNDPLPKCNVFVGMPRFDIDAYDNESDIDAYDHNNYLYLSQSKSDDGYNNSPISPLPRASKELSSSAPSRPSLPIAGHREYICCFNDLMMKMLLTMADIAQYSHNLFEIKFLSLFDYKLSQNELLQFNVYHIATKQYISIKLPLYSYHSKHYHIQAQIVHENSLKFVKTDRNHRKKKRNSKLHKIADEDEEYEYEQVEETSIYDFGDDVLNNLQCDLLSKQKEFEEKIAKINTDIACINNIYLWKKYQFEIIKIERDLSALTIDKTYDVSDDLNIKSMKLKQIFAYKLNMIKEMKHNINCDESEIMNLEKTIRRLTLEKMNYEKSLKKKQIQIKKEENICNKTQKKLKKMQQFENKYEITQKQLSNDIKTFQTEKESKINAIKSDLNYIWKQFEINYFDWNIHQALEWILSIENFYFSADKFHHFTQTLKTHQFIGKNLKELRSNFALNVMGLKESNDQQILIKNINRIINKSSNNNHSHKTNNKHSCVPPPNYRKRKSLKTVKLPAIFDRMGSSASCSSANGNLCCICAENEINTVIVPCGHMVYCSKCSKTLTIKSCPTCRGQNVSIMVTYKSGL